MISPGLEGGRHLLRVVAVALLHVPAERGELGGNVAQVHDLARRPVDLQPIEVHDRHEVAQVVVGRQHRGLPHLALLQLTVTEQTEHRRIGRGCSGSAVQPKRKRQTVGEREPLPERTGGHLHAGDLVRVRVPLQRRAQLAQRGERVAREIARLRERRVQNRRGVALRQYEPVAVRPAGPLRIVSHHAEVQRADDLDGGQGASRVSRSGRRDHLDDVAAHGNTGGLERDCRHGFLTVCGTP